MGKTVKQVWPQLRDPELIIDNNNEDAESEASAEEVPPARAPRARLSSGAGRYSSSEQFRRLRASQEHEERLMREVQ